eukprot:COSAG02_NODE_1255_length_13582_cov_43.693095_4_plen_66_part_00
MSNAPEVDEIYFLQDGERKCDAGTQIAHRKSDRCGGRRACFTPPLLPCPSFVTHWHFWGSQAWAS